MPPFVIEDCTGRPRFATRQRSQLALGDRISSYRRGAGALGRHQPQLYVPFHADGIISQFEGYSKLEDLDWDGDQRRYGDIHRLDRILEAEGDTPNRYMISKQADTLMLFYLLSAEELTVLFERLGYSFDPADQIPRTIEYYLSRTAHGSTLSRLVHSWVLARLDRRRSWEFFLDALHSDVEDVQGGTTAEGYTLAPWPAPSTSPS
ncbi:glycosyl hydrolase family 65 [Kribbella sp. VKM Ac-2527]|uniref:Glycosyl hydrolase family 65 n=1 Tax=Kribbella caucasensis TaxID=2512215 RepID=A0A4R6KHJ5_9ACTN|nr:hypothetical protein [Kribbella sp. VKM Ac-2527]TDO47954.1 glycosyl hydrolase family 65 [Kribbella sp. VKM Ac-2527]